MNNNPLLNPSAFPLFEQIDTQHLLPALETTLSKNREAISALCEANTPVDWDNFAEKLESLEEQIERIWSPVSHINAVRDSDALRAEVEKALPMLSDYGTEIGQNRGLFERYQQLAASPEYPKLSKAQRQTVENELRDFRLSGVALDPQDQARFKEINSELASLSLAYEQNVLDATQGWTLHIEDSQQLSGLPQQVIDAARQCAEKSEVEGWKFTLQAPSYIPFLTYSDQRDLRRKMHEAYVTRASDQGPNAGEWDNSEVMQQTLQLRREKARLLEMEHYAEYSLQTKMADSVDEVEAFLLKLAERSGERARNEWQALGQFALELDGIETLQAWDLAYYAEKLKQQTFSFTDEELRPYFPLDTVLKGLFEVVKRLFGLDVITASRPEVWHEDVQFFEIRDKQDRRRGWFYLDLYARENKRGGAWMADCYNRRKSGDKLQHPVAFMTCNFAQPVGTQPCLLRHDDVITLFHEFGHGLHHMLTQVNISSVAGISGVPWDAVELPSQFLENWCWQREALDFISGHVETGQPLPDALLEKMLAAKNFQAAMQMLRQVEFSLFDLRLHTNSEEEPDIQGILETVRKEVAVVPAPEFNRFAHAFSHIFAGGYAAGYYSYKWAEVLSADAFSRFEEEGIFNHHTGQDFLQHILEKGGSEPPMILFQRFRGHKPDIDPLLKHSGLI